MLVAFPVWRLLVRVSVGSVRVCGSSTTRTRVAGAGLWVVLAGRGVLSWCWVRHTDGCGSPRVATMSGRAPVREAEG